MVIDGTEVSRAYLHNLDNFEKYEFGIGDTVKVYKANMIIPQIAENVTKSGTYTLPRKCPCCGEPLTVKPQAAERGSCTVRTIIVQPNSSRNSPISVKRPV